MKPTEWARRGLSLSAQEAGDIARVLKAMNTQELVNFYKLDSSPMAVGLAERMRKKFLAKLEAMKRASVGRA